MTDAPTTPGGTRRIVARAGEHRHLLAGSAALVVGAGVQALGGALFWLVAARTADAEAVGRATALFTSTLFVAFLAGLGLQVSLARFAPVRDHDSHATFSWAVLATVIASTVVAGIYLLVVDTAATDALGTWHGAGGPGLFAVAAVGAALTLIVDVRWMAVRRWRLVLGRIVIVALTRFPLLALSSGDGDTIALFAAATLPLAATGIIGAAGIRRVTGAGHRLRPIPSTARAAVRYSMVNYLSTLAYQAPQFVLPVIVLLSVDADTNAAFYVAWGITALAMYLPMAIGQALLAEGGKDGAELRDQVRVALVLTTCLMGVATVVAGVGREVLVTVYGDDYADGARILPLLVAACVPWAVTSVFLSEARVRHAHRATVTISIVLTAGILVPALILVPRDGLDGATIAFAVGNCAAALCALVAHHRMRDRRSDSALDVVLSGGDVPPGEEDLVLHP